MLKKLVLGTVVIGGSATAAVGGYLAYNSRLKQNSAITPLEYHQKQPAIQTILQSSTTLAQSYPLVFYRYTTCPFCCKLQAYLDYHKLPYTPVEVNPLTKKEISAHGYGKVPQLQLGQSGPIIVDSEEIVNMLNPVIEKEPPSFYDPDDISKWRNWAKEDLVRFMVLNTNRTLSESREGYDYVERISSFNTLDKIVLRLTGGPIMYLVAQKVTKPKLMKAGYDGGDPRPPLYEKINSWVNDGLKGRVFHGGNKPDLADLDIYGIIQSQRFLPVFSDLINNTDPKFAEWISNMDALMPSKYKI